MQFLLKIESCKKGVKDESSGEQPKLTNYVICFLLFCVIVKIFLTETAKISQYSQCLHSLFTQFWDAFFYLFVVLVLANKTAMS